MYPGVRIDRTAVDIEVVFGKHFGPFVNGSA